MLLVRSSTMMSPYSDRSTGDTPSSAIDLSFHSRVNTMIACNVCCKPGDPKYGASISHLFRRAVAACCKPLEASSGEALAIYRAETASKGNCRHDSLSVVTL